MTYENTIKSNTNKKAIAAIIAAGILLLSFTCITGGQRTYQVRPEIELPEYKTDNTRMIEAYERLMDRYMNLVEKNLMAIELENKNTAEKLDNISKKLDEIFARTAKIEKALGIEETKSPINKTQVMQEPDSKGVTTEGQKE